MHTKPNRWLDRHNWRTWSIAGIAALLVVTAALYATDMFPGATLPDIGNVTIPGAVSE